MRRWRGFARPGLMLTVLPCLAALLTLCGPSIPRAPLPSDDAAILAAVARDQHLARPGPAGRYCVVQEESEALEISDGDPTLAGTGVPAGCLQDLARRNVVPATLPAFDAGATVHRVSRSRLDFIWTRGWWREFYGVFPDADSLCMLPLPEYSADAQSALV